MSNQDPTSASRKQDHIELAFESVVNAAQNDTRFQYEPLLSAHPSSEELPTSFLGKSMRLPLWVSSMTGGTELAGKINKNLAQACAEFGMGMGLGSCRNLLYEDTYFEDFNLRPIIGADLPFFANLGVAQVEELLRQGETARITDMVGKLAADGLIVHVNPLQEWLQPEGDRFKQSPLATIQELLEKVDIPIIVKEVGQGMGPESIRALMQLPIAALDFGALGGTNFSRLELQRANKERRQLFDNLSNVGHTASEMTNFVNTILEEEKGRIQCDQVIISGGIRSFLDGWHLINSINTNAIYAQGSGFLAHARGDYQLLKNYVAGQAKGLALAQAYLKVK